MGEDNNMNLEEHTFQEQTRYKLAVSAFIACIGLMCLGFGLAFAGQSDAARIAADNSSGEVEDSNTALSSGYGNNCHSKYNSFSVFLYTLLCNIIRSCDIYIYCCICDLCMCGHIFVSVMLWHCEGIRVCDEQFGRTELQLW